MRLVDYRPDLKFEEKPGILFAIEEKLIPQELNNAIVPIVSVIKNIFFIISFIDVLSKIFKGDKAVRRNRSFNDSPIVSRLIQKVLRAVTLQILPFKDIQKQDFNISCPFKVKNYDIKL